MTGQRQARRRDSFLTSWEIGTTRWLPDSQLHSTTRLQEARYSGTRNGRCSVGAGQREGKDQTREDHRPMSAASDEQSPELADRRLALLVAALVGLEAVLLLVGAVVLLIDTFTSDRDNLGAASALAAVLVVLGVALAVCARGVIRGQRWTRGPVLTWQLLQAGVAMPLSTTRLWWVGVPLLAMAIVAGVLIAGRHV